MATNRRKRKRNMKNIVPLDESIIQYYFTGEALERDTPAWELNCSRFFGGNEIQENWLYHRDAILAEWKRRNPGVPWPGGWN